MKTTKVSMWLVPVLTVVLGCSGPARQPQQDASAAGAAAPVAGAAPATAVPPATPGAPVGGSGSGAGGGSAPPGAAVSAPPASGAAASGAPVVEAAKVPEYREVTVPAGTAISVVLESAVASDTSAVEHAVRGRIHKAIVVGGLTAVPLDTPIAGNVTAANRSAKVKGRASVAFRLDSVTLDNERIRMKTTEIRREAPGTKKEDAKKVGIGAAGGAIVGAIIGGKKGAGIGTATGAGAGTGVVLATRGAEVRLPVGTVVSTRLLEPLTVRVRVTP